jgi:hypothetical protein
MSTIRHFRASSRGRLVDAEAMMDLSERFEQPVMKATPRGPRPN